MIFIMHWKLLFISNSQLCYYFLPAVNSHDTRNDYDTDLHFASSQEGMNITITRKNCMFTLILVFY